MADAARQHADLIDRSPDILGGTRVPVRSLLDYLESGQRLDDFLQDFPTVRRAQAVAVLERATALVLG